MNIGKLSENIIDIKEEKIIVEEHLDIEVSPKGSKTGFYKEFFAEGKLKSTAWWKDGMLNGEYIEYDKFGNIIEHSYYKDNNKKKTLIGLEGLQEQRLDKKLVEVYYYKNGKIDGEYKRWMGERLIFHGIYNNGELIEKIEDGRDFNSLIPGENKLNESLNDFINYDKYNLSFGRFNYNKSEFIVPAFPGKNNIQEIRRIIKEKLNIFEDVIYDGSNYYFFIK